MKDGFLKVCACTPEIRVADCSFNADSIIETMFKAQKLGASVAVFPELCVTGYTCQDLFLQKLLLDGAVEALDKICRETESLSALFAVGTPLAVNGKLYSCAAVISKGKILGVVPKTSIPNYNEFYEVRHFSSAPEKNELISLCNQEVLFGKNLLFCCKEIPELVFGIEICEDLWTPSPRSTALALAGATLIGNLSASDEVIGKDSYRRSLVSNQSARLVCGYIYCSCGNGESTQDLVFSGHNLICENGAVLSESKLFENEITYSEIDLFKLAHERRRITTFPKADSFGFEKIYFSLPVSKTVLTRHFSKAPFIPSDMASLNERCDMILQIQSHGLKKRLEHTHAASAVIGISGGLDSCLALLVAVRAMDLLGRDRKDIIAVTMPCFGTTKRTRSNAELLCECLGVSFKEVNITKSVIQHFEDIGHDINEHNVVYENGQARERTKVLMDIANKTSGLVIGTGDLSELALGWATYNGDHMSMYGVNSSVPKTLIRHIIRYYADISHDDSLKSVLLDILDTPVSPELLPTDETASEMTQKTEDIVGPYELHDFFLYYFVRFGFSPQKILRIAKYAFEGVYDEAVISKWLNTFIRRFFSQQFKRSCLPDGPKVGSVTLSPRGDWRMPSDASSALWQII